MTALDFIVRRDNLRECKVVTAREPGEFELGDGQALLAVDKFAFTSNNVTYAAFGEAMNYWAFFPAPEGWGRIPVWGFGEVVRTTHPDVRDGERVFGYLPMSTHLVLKPDGVTESGFIDASPHRVPLPEAYQQYTRVSGSDEHEDHQAILQPLFMTSFLIEDFLSSADLFGASAVVHSSASSKTALGVAFLLSKNRPLGCEVIGLTSPGNASFCERVGYYDRVIPYAELASLPPDMDTVLVDMAGDGKLLKSVHDHFKDNLKHSCIVGATHWEDREAPGDLPGPVPQFFFAPTQLAKRRQEWGAEGFGRRYGEARSAFLPSTDEWMKIVHLKGPEAVREVYLAMVDGRVDPQVGQMLSLHE
jgi:uncharacterized protein DUF2855